MLLAPPTHQRLVSSLLAVPARAQGVCRICRDLIPPGYAACRHCRRHPELVDVVAPLALSSAPSPLHAALRGYKDAPDLALRDELTRSLSRVLDSFLDRHWPCLGRAAGVSRFDAFTVVPSSTPARDRARSRLRMIGALIEAPGLPHFERLLWPTGQAPSTRRYDERRFRSARHLNGAAVLLRDDMWVTGARAQSSAAALPAARAVHVAAVVLG